ncbi:MAG TPA: 1-(5-phosphoribosyl)-5-[(5-phosphoribosylamino)methylideneamino]imidazole-4-carboxamide isomerase [Candidatus Avoscillospira avistercoris]|uniref:1-(5-phosphoribosyl)-5-[(5-phosphoribosylamino)methylideneamino] imidazole-4-carboxamide isomerase n=1 Tax=Candidatus Avoscillospira avistercoris TaxID=2840707 RepID=A0A9D1JTR3_9FIRM|nr:1-(5-phosphoribosyl)-5-[(5-phosphoribosylamino)methylideneamino]imidazole-4-carboxamide isomerase [Candidatus Avoscillospira avistercoris]
MNLFPAIDLYTGWAVRLYQGDYNQMTVYDKDPLSVAKRFRDAGAEYLHMVDLEGAKTGETPNLDTVRAVAAQSGLQVEIGGGIRSEEVIKQYLDAGVLRVILGTAAITQPGFVGEMVAKYGDKIAVGVDVRDGFVAIKGWTELSDRTCFDFCRDMDSLGVKTIICTDISKDGVLGGTNLELYKQLSETLSLDIVASGGVSSLDDIAALQKMGLYGAILGKAVYTGAIDLAKAVALAKGAAV